MHQWAELLPQANITLNLLRPFADNETISAYEGMFKKQYDFLANPLAPPGTKVVVYEPNDKRPSWSPHGIEGFYLGPALNHYRSMRTFIPSTNGYRTSDQIDYFPTKLLFPGASTAEMLIEAIAKVQLNLKTTNVISPELVSAITQLTNAVTKFKLDEPSPGPRNADCIPIEETPTAKRVRFATTLPISTDNANQDTQSPKRVILADHPHPLRKQKAPTIKGDFYRTLTNKECKIAAHLRDKLGKHFIDTDGAEEIVIDSLVKQNITSGPGSKTFYYKMYNVTDLLRPTVARDYMYTPCSELNTSKYVSWLPGKRNVPALSVISSTPRSYTRALNQTTDG
jgi:hypothetical protein